MRNKFSVLNTESKVFLLKKKKIFEKTFQLNIPEMNNDKILNRLIIIINNYYYQIKNSGIPVPRMIGLNLKSKKIICRMKYEGKNLVENKKNLLNHKNFQINVNKIFEILKIAKKNKIKIDPHIKNFVLNNKKEIYYVDIFPPYVKQYEKLRSKFYQTIEEKKICDKNFSFFNHNILFYHFVADLIKFNKSYEKKIDYFYNTLKNKKIINSDIIYFKKKIKQIIEVEQLRVKKKFYLA